MTFTPRVIFHLGFQKTGTTSVQALLNSNLSLLSDVDVRVYGDATKDLRAAGKNFCAEPSPDREKELIKTLERHFSLVFDNGKPVCLISDENILGRVPYSNTGDVVSWAERILPVIEGCASGTDLAFHFYTRPAESWRNSMYRQCVKRAGVTGSYGVWARSSPFQEDWPDWKEWADRISKATSAPVTFTCMDEELKSGAVLGTALLENAGLSEAAINALIPVERQNMALSDAALQFMRFVNLLPLKERLRLRISERVEAFDSRAKHK
ncbi:hypothetical protein [Ruegeria sp.]|uniref:hypothetical protein n=1 Tax=Ruegeria sp. TaxID=1879320 RepID=UPI003C7E668C